MRCYIVKQNHWSSLGGKSTPPLTFTVFLKKKFKTFILESDFSWDGGGILPQISYEPYQDLWKATM
jgi:hypothetical protein